MVTSLALHRYRASTHRRTLPARSVKSDTDQANPRKTRSDPIARRTDAPPPVQCHNTFAASRARFRVGRECRGVGSRRPRDLQTASSSENPRPPPGPAVPRAVSSSNRKSGRRPPQQRPPDRCRRSRAGCCRGEVRRGVRAPRDVTLVCRGADWTCTSRMLVDRPGTSARRAPGHRTHRFPTLTSASSVPLRRRDASGRRPASSSSQSQTQHCHSTLSLAVTDAPVRRVPALRPRSARLAACPAHTLLVAPQHLLKSTGLQSGGLARP